MYCIHCDSDVRADLYVNCGANLFKFEKEQQVFDFNGTYIGGQNGEYPRVLDAYLFYNKH